MCDNVCCAELWVSLGSRVSGNYVKIEMLNNFFFPVEMMRIRVGIGK